MSIVNETALILLRLFLQILCADARTEPEQGLKRVCRAREEGLESLTLPDTYGGVSFVYTKNVLPWPPRPNASREHRAGERRFTSGESNFTSGE